MTNATLKTENKILGTQLPDSVRPALTQNLLPILYILYYQQSQRSRQTRLKDQHVKPNKSLQRLEATTTSMQKPS